MAIGTNGFGAVFLDITVTKIPQKIDNVMTYRREYCAVGVEEEREMVLD